MFKWYEASTVCYAYISDFDSETQLDVTELQYVRWFARGWTLQELVAPVDVVFYDVKWNELGTKSSMASSLAEWTTIPIGVLENTVSHLSIPVIKRMTWAHSRKTTRTEDIAYCLLGIFDVNMPLLYGEGDRAFTRLQAEILRTTNDDTILLGGLNLINYQSEGVVLTVLPALEWHSRILADSSYGSDVDAFPDPDAHGIEPPTIIGSRLLMNLPLKPIGPIACPSQRQGVYYGALNCLDHTGQRRLVRYFKTSQCQVDASSMDPFCLETCNLFWWIPKDEVACWQVQRCIVSLRSGGRNPTNAQTLHPFGEPGSQSPWTPYQTCSACGQPEHGWTWVNCSYLPPMSAETMTSVYLLKLERPVKVVFVVLMFIAPSVRRRGRYCRVGLERLATTENNGGEAGLEALLRLQERWENVTKEGQLLVHGQKPHRLKGVWSKPLVEGRGPVAKVSTRVPVCSGTAEMVATLTCRECWHGGETYIPELRFQRFMPCFEPEE